MFILYLSAARAGFVADFSGWLDQTQRYGFWENINRTHYNGKSLYQFTQFNTWMAYQFFGTHHWLWHLFFISLHALNATLLFRLTNRLLDHSGFGNGWLISLTGVVLFSLSPYLSETIVWEPAYHFLQGLLLILLIISWTQSYIVSGKPRYIWLTGITYFLSTFSLEIFYITPWLVLFMVIFYRYLHPGYVRGNKKTMLFIFLPQVILFGFHLVLFHWIYGSWVAHIGAATVAEGLQDGWGNPESHLAHIIFLARFFPVGVRQSIYAFTQSLPGVISFNAFVAFIAGYILLRFKNFSGKGKVVALFFTWMMITLVILVPLWLEKIFVVAYDRYIYFTCAFLYMLIALLLSYISLYYVRIGITVAYMLANLRFTIQVSRYWMKSARVIDSLLKTFPYATDKTVILLNVPQNMKGVPMIGAEKDSEFRLMHNLLLPGLQIKTQVYDAMAYNMLTPEDGATATMLNDSTVQVVLNQWGTWWWFAMMGGQSYENNDYKLNLKDPGHMYEMTLKKPAANYLLLYQQGGQWKELKQ